MAKHIDLTGTRLANAVVLRYSHRDERNNKVWVCRCDCGKEYTGRTAKIREGYSAHCGCMRKENHGRTIRTHGMTGTPEFKSWEGAKARCRSPNSKDWNRYGGRGIRFCERWDQFENFYADMGAKPGPDYSLDRIDPDGDYCPENCRWASHITQQSNRRNNIMIQQNGRRITLFEFFKRNRKSGYARARERIRRGWSVADAIFQPPTPRELRTKLPI